ncbi:hypothetical protein CWR48_02815 [Oceanobacillus arenosus]|uniref:DUF624 domain-containing protein n=1 Tax=Oceanobacillus arenosus TaxID=1229153 RepID=A0A3D8PYX5_9BACI|nr:DUF624 domain-containing protein [Oceanobacillus arenosus]RDW21356.1 hypothetical protein CWR48_02815 [Oceanobacillus arenosus]
MPINRFSAFVYKISDWIMKLVLVNILWILLSLFGLLIFGFFPATIAMFSVIRSLSKKEEISIFKKFLYVYKQEFLNSNLMGSIIILVTIIFYLDIRFVQEINNEIFQLLYYPLVILNLIFYLIVLYIFPTYVQYDSKIIQLFKNAFLIMIMNPLITIVMLSSSVVLLFAIVFFPAIILFFSGSIFALFIMSAATTAFEKVEQKKVEFHSRS